MFRILSLSLLLATLAVSQSSESSTPTVTTAIVKSSTSSSVFSFTATTAVDYTINTPYPMPTSTNIPKSSVQGNSSVQFTFPKAGDYWATQILLGTPMNDNGTAVYRRNYAQGSKDGWTAIWTWPSDVPKQNISFALCTPTQCIPAMLGEGVRKYPWHPTEKERSNKNFTNWPKDTYYTNVYTAYDMESGVLPYIPIADKYQLKMITAELNGTVLAASDYFDMKITNITSPNMLQIPKSDGSGASGLHIPSTTALVALLFAALLVV